MSSFSTYAPSYDFYFKPAVSAPGGNILSTYPLALGGYAVLSGTSMATPFIAGTSALLLAAKGKNAAIAKEARNIFETTATKVPSSLTDGEPYQTLTQAGAGLVDAYAAIRGTTVVSTGELVLNDTAHFQGMYVLFTSNSLPTFQANHLLLATRSLLKTPVRQPRSIHCATFPPERHSPSRR